MPLFLFSVQLGLDLEIRTRLVLCTYAFSLRCSCSAKVILTDEIDKDYQSDDYEYDDRNNCRAL